MFSITDAKFFVPIVLALIGGCVRVLRKGEERTMTQVIATLLASGFVGVLVYMLLQDFRMPDGIKVAAVGASGYSAGSLLPIIEKWMSNEASKRAGDRNERS